MHMPAKGSKGHGTQGGHTHPHPHDHEHGPHTHTHDERQSIPLEMQILDENQKIAEENRKAFKKAGVCVINLISSPGSGKTTLLERTIPELQKAGLPPAVIEGDITTTADSDRIAVLGVQVTQIQTEQFGGACHLEAQNIREALKKIDLAGVRILFIENVGNLVCPAEFYLGEDATVVLISITEGEDKPLKYPLAFHKAHAAIINKMDLLPHLRVDIGKLKSNLSKVNPGFELMPLSAQSGEGMDHWLEWIRKTVQKSAE